MLDLRLCLHLTVNAKNMAYNCVLKFKCLGTQSAELNESESECGSESDDQSEPRISRFVRRGS